jgi:hypothetical protein
VRPTTSRFSSTVAVRPIASTSASLRSLGTLTVAGVSASSVPAVTKTKALTKKTRVRSEVPEPVRCVIGSILWEGRP